jgi:two-component system response regulator AlgR
MPGRDGLQLAAEVARLPDPPAVVFVTAHAGHALAAFDLAAVDYLTKPVRRERLHAALQRAAARRPATPAHPPGSEPVLVVHEAGRVLRIPAAEVLYLKAELKYVTLRTARATHLLDDALSDLEQRLGDRFLRVHRNALVARHALRTLERRPSGGSGGHGDTGEAPDETAAAASAGGQADGADAGSGWTVSVHPVGEWLAVSRRQVAAVREAMKAGQRR